MNEEFKEYLTNLEIEEIEISKRIVSGLKKRIGKEQSIDNNQIIKILKKEKINLSDYQIRKIMHYIRERNIIPRLCSHSKGYFVAKNDQEWFKWIEYSKLKINSMIYILICATEKEEIVNIDKKTLTKVK